MPSGIGATTWGRTSFGARNQEPEGGNSVGLLALPRERTMPKPQYGTAHRRRRAQWKAELTRTGGRRCACRGQCGRHRGRCPEWITAGSAWDLAHGTAHTLGGDGSDSQPMCSGCNRAEGARLKARNARDSVASEDWW